MRSAGYFNIPGADGHGFRASQIFTYSICHQQSKLAVRYAMAFLNKKIAVIGGGLGGASFVNATLYAGLDNISLYERAPEFTEVGAGVDLTRNANLVLDAYGLK